MIHHGTYTISDEGVSVTRFVRFPSRTVINYLARGVIKGNFGNGPERKKALGYLYEPVQEAVNEMVGSPTKVIHHSHKLQKKGRNSVECVYCDQDSRSDELTKVCSFSHR